MERGNLADPPVLQLACRGGPPPPLSVCGITQARSADERERDDGWREMAPCGIRSRPRGVTGHVLGRCGGGTSELRLVTSPRLSFLVILMTNVQRVWCNVSRVYARERFIGLAGLHTS